MITFSPTASMLESACAEACCACVVIPARDEARSLGDVIDRLAAQVCEDGRSLSYERYEVLVLLNNCRDESAAVARAASRRHPGLGLHVMERELPAGSAHVGTARRMLMDTAWHRLRGSRQSHTAILSTDADTLVARDWVAETMRAIRGGADAVGGEICWCEGELAGLPAGVRRAFEQDRRYQVLLAELEDTLDPQEGDRLPRHMHHFGASLACTPVAYALAGGLPRLRSLEDVALVRALRRTGARVRHEPRVRVYTSGRRDGRCEVGLSGQLRDWEEMCAAGTPHWVTSAEWWVHRLRLLRALRLLVREERWGEALEELPEHWRRRVRQMCRRGRVLEEVLLLLPFERLLEETFSGWGALEISAVIGEMERVLGELRVIAVDGRDNVKPVDDPALVTEGHL